jgi:hypothetical protein
MCHVPYKADVVGSNPHRVLNCFLFFYSTDTAVQYGALAILIIKHALDM